MWEAEVLIMFVFAMVWRPALGAGSQKVHLKLASVWEVKVMFFHWLFNVIA